MFNINKDTKRKVVRYAVPAILTAGVILTNQCFADPGDNSLVFVTKFTEQVNNFLKKEGRVALELCCAGAGGWYSFKTGTWTPVITCATSAGLVETLFRMIT